MQKIIARAHLPTALIATNDYVARGAIEALDTVGIRVPEHVSIVGYDDLGISVSPPLTTIRADLEEVGRLAMEVLRRRIEGSPNSGPITVPVDLIERGSSAPLLQATRERSSPV
jgi:LacI family transcriptional regulator